MPQTEAENRRIAGEVEKIHMVIAENILNREFTADAPNQKWLADVTEYKYYEGDTKHKV